MILSYLIKNKSKKNSIYSRDIQKEFRIKKSFVSSLLTSLEEKKFIIRKQEGKKKRIIITKIGAKTIFSSFLTDKQIKKISEERDE